MKCTECNGKGFIELFISSSKCDACGGTGKEVDWCPPSEVREVRLLGDFDLGDKVHFVHVPGVWTVSKITLPAGTGDYVYQCVRDDDTVRDFSEKTVVKYWNEVGLSGSERYGAPNWSDADIVEMEAIPTYERLTRDQLTECGDILISKNRSTKIHTDKYFAGDYSGKVYRKVEQ